MKVIDIDEIIEIVDTKFDEVISKTLNWGDVCMFPNTRKLFNLKIAIINELNTLKIIEEPKTNFNISDRVKNIKNMSKLDYCNKYIGLKGTIINIDDSDNVEPYFVKFDNGEKEWFKHNELELVEEPKEEFEEIELIEVAGCNIKTRYFSQLFTFNRK